MQTELSERTSEYGVGTIHCVESLPKDSSGAEASETSFAFCFFISFVVLGLEKCS
jgi:hypothetical protein